ncbi:MAG: MOSC domain-containing protein [Candidatus Eremiobacteraeota bacterium]|nr:MOSC domain-containing protein [Candidatus Eremiobacteraeota bacterium]
MSDRGTVVSVNVARKALVVTERRRFTTAIRKRPIATERAELGDDRVAGDDQADNESHGGPDRAVYAYACEDYAWWEAQLGRPLPPGLFGENLTLTGIDVNGAAIGERWRVGDAILRVTSPRIPCYKLAHVVGEPDFVKRFAQAHRPGAYLAIERAATIGRGAAVEVISRPDAILTLAEFNKIYFDERERAAEFLAIPAMTDAWRAWAREQLATHRAF